MCPAPLIELALHAEEPGFISLIIQVHGWFLRLHNSVGSLPAFAMYTAFPCSDYYAGSAPSIHHLQSPWLARLRRRAANQGSHVPVLDLHFVGGILYPWRFRATTCEEIIVAGSVNPDPSVENFKPHQIRSHNSRSHLTYYGSVVAFKTEASNICFVVSP